jgi:hypothetical protein
MTKNTFEPDVWTQTQAWRETFMPVHRAQQEGLKALERLMRFQYSVAGEYLQNSLAQAQAALSSSTPSEFLSKQAELRTRFEQWLSSRAQELTTLASETQREFTQSAGEATSPSESAGPEGEEPGSSAHGRRRRERRARPG